MKKIRGTSQLYRSDFFIRRNARYFAEGTGQLSKKKKERKCNLGHPYKGMLIDKKS